MGKVAGQQVATERWVPSRALAFQHKYEELRILMIEYRALSAPGRRMTLGLSVTNLMTNRVVVCPCVAGASVLS